jgi:hypothetical protein
MLTECDQKAIEALAMQVVIEHDRGRVARCSTCTSATWAMTLAPSAHQGSGPIFLARGEPGKHCWQAVDALTQRMQVREEALRYGENTDGGETNA